MCKSSVVRAAAVSRLGRPPLHHTNDGKVSLPVGTPSKRPSASLHSTFFVLVFRYGFTHTKTLATMNVQLRSLFDVGLVDEPLKQSDRRYGGKLEEEREWKTAR